MLEIENYLFPENLDEAYTTLQNTPGAVILGGCGYIRLGSRKIGTAVDLSRLGLDSTNETSDTIEIGAMCSLRKFETEPLLAEFCNGLLQNSVKNIVGIQLRSCVTIGGTIAGRYPFSDPITALMALEATIELHNHGILPLKEYLHGKAIKDIVTRIIIPKRSATGAFVSVRKSTTDYAVLNAAVVKADQTFKVIVGSRPGKAVDIPAIEDFLQNNEFNQNSITKAAKLSTGNVELGDNPRGSRAYREAICPVLIRRALQKILEEVEHAG